jgi:DNA-binding NarL/FixJ family response regulator
MHHENKRGAFEISPRNSRGQFKGSSRNSMRTGGEVTMRQQECFASIVVGKNILFREGFAAILRSANFRILASVSCANDLLPSKFQLHQPLFLIVHTGDNFDATLEQIEIFRDQHRDGRIAIVADHYPLGELASAFRAGANGCFVDNMNCDEFIKSMEFVMMGETMFPAACLSFLLAPEGDHLRETAPRDEEDQALRVTTEDPTPPQLSPRERSILRCLIEGDSNKCIARKIDIAEATVKAHVQAILRKIRVQSRTQAAIWGMNNRSLTRPENNSSLPITSDGNKPLADPVEVISEIKKIESSAPLQAINEANHVEVARIDRLIIRKGVSRIHGTSRRRK